MEPTTGASPPPPPQPPQPPIAPAKKKTSPWVWVLVGCLGLFVIGGIILGAGALFVAKKAKDFVADVAENPVRKSVEMIVRLNPDLDLVSTDDEAQTMTLRNNKSGEVSTFDWSDIQNGNFTFEADGEEYTVDGSGAADGRIAMKDKSGNEVMAFGPGSDEVPSWFPQYPDSAEINVLVNANQNGQQSSIWTFQTGAAVTDVLGFYEQKLGSDGWEVSTSTSSVGAVSNASIEAKRDGGAKTLNIVVTKNGGEAAQAMVSYTSTGG